jgi:hypothetical protein
MNVQPHRGADDIAGGGVQVLMELSGGREHHGWHRGCQICKAAEDITLYED